jgi:hypothetical protein
MDAGPCILKSRPALFFTLLAFGLYAATAARTIQWQDSAQFTYRIGIGKIDNTYGLAMVHPFHFMLGRAAVRILPNHVPWALSLVSALGGAVAVGFTAGSLKILTRNQAATALGACSLILAHTFWRFSCLPEVYTWSAALLMAQVWVYLRTVHQGNPNGWWGIFALNGIAWSNHNLALLTLAVWGITVLLHLRRGTLHWQRLFGMALLWGIGSLPYTALIVRQGMQSGDWASTLHSALFGEGFREQVTGFFPHPVYTLVSLAFVALSFPLLTILLPSRLRVMAKQFPLPLAAILLLQSAFFLRYNVIDQYTFLIPIYPLLALTTGLAYARITASRLRQIVLALLILQPMGYAVLPALVHATGSLQAYARHKPFRDDAEYLFWPWRMLERSAQNLADAALAAAGPGGAIVVADPMAWHTLKWERHARGRTADIRLLRPDQDREILDRLTRRDALVWAPLRTIDPVPEGWREQGGVWVPDPNWTSRMGLDILPP